MDGWMVWVFILLFFYKVLFLKIPVESTPIQKIQLWRNIVLYKRLFSPSAIWNAQMYLSLLIVMTSVIDSGDTTDEHVLSLAHAMTLLGPQNHMTQLDAVDCSR